MSHPFLSDEWIDAARAIREEYRGQAPPAAHVVRMNLVVNEVPFGEATLQAHMDSTTGEMELDLGHLDGPDLTATLDYETAKTLIVAQDPQAGMQAFMAGKIRIEGDITKLMAMQASAANALPVAVEIANRIKDITA